MSERVGEGTFTVEADKEALGAVAAALIDQRKSQAKQEADITMVRPDFGCSESQSVAPRSESDGAPLYSYPLDSFATCTLLATVFSSAWESKKPMKTSTR